MMVRVQRPTRVAILGATGSIGRQALEVIAAHPDRLVVTALAAGTRREELRELAATLNVKHVATGDDDLVALATADDVDLVLVATPGIAGLQPTLAALAAGKDVALANKEVLVVGGHLVRAACGGAGKRLRPVDSEHAALWQCLAGVEPASVRRVAVTASGGPFRDRPLASFGSITAEEALRHPTWRMGKKITVDSATLVNKALEVIEARFLFDVPYERVDVVVHPQSLIHAFVEFVDGSVLAQVGFPTMELPILYALTHPERVPDAGIRRFDPVAAGTLTFEPVQPELYPAYRLGRAAAQAGGTAPAAFNAANEVAVQRFLDGAITFGRIAEVIEAVLAGVGVRDAGSLPAVLAADAEARRLAREAACS